MLLLHQDAREYKTSKISEMKTKISWDYNLRGRFLHKITSSLPQKCYLLTSVGTKQNQV